MKKVIIEWFDASALSHDSKTWLTKQEALDVAEKKYSDHCVTLGFLLEKNKRYIVVSATKADSVYADSSVIPAGMIHKIKFIK